MKIWHDDIRRPPNPTWVWARTNAHAKYLLELAKGGGLDHTTHISLDHDLGLHDLDPDVPGAVGLRGEGEETGLQLVRWMVAHDCVPPQVTIHSWNGVGAQRMAQYLNDAGYDCICAPYALGAHIIDQDKEPTSR